MENFDEFEIQFVGLKEGKHYFNYHIGPEFFALFEYENFNAVAVDVELLMVKKSNMLELFFTLKGSVNVNCDLSNEPYDQPIDGNLSLVVKFGAAYNDDDDELLILPHGQFKLEVQQYIYEATILAVPYKKVHPRVADGTMDSKILDKLDELSPGNSAKNEHKTDPRWDKLKELLNDK